MFNPDSIGDRVQHYHLNTTHPRMLKLRDPGKLTKAGRNSKFLPISQSPVSLPAGSVRNKNGKKWSK